MRLALASDHAGFAFKRKLAEELAKAGHQVHDFGCPNEQPADLSDFAAPAAQALGEGKFDRAILVDGAGYGSGMIANLFHGVFAAVCNDPVSAKLAREHGGANALCVGTMVAGELVLRETVKVFLETEALGGKYAARREKIAKIAEKQRLGPLFRTRQLVTVEDLRDAILRKEPLILDERTVITPSVLDGVRALRP
jgi:ribose 5-phosphate isomerase B